ncbi:hypothetical protein NC651_019080 [Populus alba x Populus x berolinensis]|nr:hypothetical protein NC651_019080 [Populus alba x Populus x berolinensis]
MTKGRYPSGVEIAVLAVAICCNNICQELVKYNLEVQFRQKNRDITKAKVKTTRILLTLLGTVRRRSLSQE